MQSYILKNIRIRHAIVLCTVIHSLEQFLDLLHPEKRIHVFTGMHRVLDNDIFLSIRISYDNIKQISPVCRVAEPQDRHGIRISLTKQI